MPRYNAPFEIHVHGDVPLRPDASFDQIQEALKPLWKYAGARSLADGANSVYEEEPGIRFEQKEHVLQICNSKERPSSDTPLAALAHGCGCNVCFDLVPEKRVEG